MDGLVILTSFDGTNRWPFQRLCLLRPNGFHVLLETPNIEMGMPRLGYTDAFTVFWYGFEVLHLLFPLLAKLPKHTESHKQIQPNP